jgi:hypothetical protein
MESQAIAREDGRPGWVVRFLKMDRGFHRCIDFTVRRCLTCHFPAVAADEFVIVVECRWERILGPNKSSHARAALPP